MKPFTTIAAVIFAIVCVAHVLRLCLGWSVLVNGVALPLWGSGVGAVVSGALAFLLWRESHQR